MDTEKIGLKLFLTSLVLVLCVEILAVVTLKGTGWDTKTVLAAARIAEIILLLLMIHRHGNGMATLGLRRDDLLPGLRTGLIWSAGFAVVAAAGGLVIFALGSDPAAMIRTPLPEKATTVLGFFVLAGLIGPIAEEIFFRGIVYGFFRKWGVTWAIIITTIVFVMMHSVKGIPVTQAVGGVVFAIAYETGKSLMVPMVIHILGNCAIFSLSLIL